MQSTALQERQAQHPGHLVPHLHSLTNSATNHTSNLACRWVSALKMLVGIVKSERAAARAVWPPGAPESEAAFDEVVTRSVVAATHAGAFIVASKRTPEKVTA